MGWKSNGCLHAGTLSPAPSLALPYQQGSEVELSTGPKETRRKQTKDSIGIVFQPQHKANTSKCWVAWGMSIIPAGFVQTCSDPDTCNGTVTPRHCPHAEAGQPHMDLPKADCSRTPSSLHPCQILTQNQGAQRMWSAPRPASQNPRFGERTPPSGFLLKKQLWPVPSAGLKSLVCISLYEGAVILKAPPKTTLGKNL